MFNCHIHTFTNQDVPQNLIPKPIQKFIQNDAGYFLLKTTLKNILPFVDKEVFDKIHDYIQNKNYKSQEEIFLFCKKMYPKDTIFFSLAMDFAYMNAGKVLRSYKEQIKELGELSLKHNILPFIHIDPRRKEYFELLQYSYEKYNFKGVKLYTTLGYFPFDKKLYKVYDFCDKNNLQVISHCSPYNPLHYKGEKLEIREMLKNSKVKIPSKKLSPKELCAYFAHPFQYNDILKDFPNVNFSLAHFGSKYYIDRYLKNDFEDNWFLHIQNMIENNNNLFTDISFVASSEKYVNLFKEVMKNKKISNKILNGSDYYSLSSCKSEKVYSNDFSYLFGNEDYSKIAEVNPKSFLKIT